MGTLLQFEGLGSGDSNQFKWLAMNIIFKQERVQMMIIIELSAKYKQQYIHFQNKLIYFAISLIFQYSFSKTQLLKLQQNYRSSIELNIHNISHFLQLVQSQFTFLTLSLYYLNKMNKNIRNKRKNIERALQSIKVSHNPQHMKVQTQNSEPFCIIRDSQQKLNIPTANDDKGIRAIRKYRYKINKQQDDQSNLNKYKSLQLAKKNMKRMSEHKLNPYASIQNSPYKPLQQKKSVQRISAHQSSRPIFSKVINRDRKLSIPKKTSLTKIRESSFDQKQAWQIKQSAKQLIKKNNYPNALKMLQAINQGTQSDIQLLDLTGVCLMNLKRFQEAIIKFCRILLLDKSYNKKVYISLALCENQLNKADRCLYYINQCIELFPDFYEGFYFKGKLLYKQKIYPSAIEMFLEASRLKPSKLQIKILIAECYELIGDIDKALFYYKDGLPQLNEKNIKFGVRYGSVLVQESRQVEAVSILQSCIRIIEGSSSFQEEKIKANYYLCLTYFRIKNYDMCIMRGEQILNANSIEYIPKTIKIMMTCKILQHNYYEGIYLLRRADFFESGLEELRIFIAFSQGVMLLMKRKLEEGVAKLETLSELLKEVVQDEFNVYINKNYRLFIIYGYFIEGRYSECSEKMKQQKQIGIDAYFENSITYHLNICQVMIKYNRQAYAETQELLNSCLQMFPQKGETYLYLALLYFKLYFTEKSQQIRLQLKSCIINNLTICIDILGSLNSNYAAHLYYYRALFYAWEGEWALSACDIDIAMEKSQDNFFNFYYLRALVIANLHNYKQAINDVSIALSMNEEAAFAYLLRAKCLQIDGNPSQAFADLQTFIALRPQDKQIHKFAGHLLFENGAFEDALQAYGQGDIDQTDFEVYLTRSKTHFLLGNFMKSAEDMVEAGKIQPSSQINFDCKIIQWLGQLFHQFEQNKKDDIYQFDKQILAQNLRKLTILYQQSSNQANRYGKIFKLGEYLSLRALCNFYLSNYQLAIDNLIEAIELKELSLQHQQDGQFEQQQAQKLIYINQMYYNITLCCCMLQDYPNAERYLKKCEISPQLHNYETHLQLIDQIKGKIQVEESEIYMDIFSLKNKLSKYLPKVRVPFLFKENQTLRFRQFKICIPYPKVQPPQINPEFDHNLLHQIDLNNVERRPDAPWIFRQKNSIKFTDRIDVYSRFQMQKSQIEQNKKNVIGSNLSNSSLQFSQVDMKEKLKLDSKVEERLKRLMNEKKK